MVVELFIAGFGCLVLAAGHAAIGLQVVPHLTKRSAPATSFGSPALTASMLIFTWHVVTLVLLTFAGLLLWLAWASDTESRTVLLRWIGALWLAVTAMGIWMARRRLSTLIRLPVPVVSAVIAAMCWKASL